MRKIIVEVPDKECWECDLSRVLYGKLICPLSTKRRNGVKIRPVKACRDAEFEAWQKENPKAQIQSDIPITIAKAIVRNMGLR
jgi:hypothetical protein